MYPEVDPYGPVTEPYPSGAYSTYPGYPQQRPAFVPYAPAPPPVQHVLGGAQGKVCDVPKPSYS